MQGLLKNTLPKFIFTVVALLTIASNPVSASLSGSDIQSIVGNTPFYDPNSVCDPSQVATTGLTSGSVYILGDSITVRAASLYTSSFQQKSITTNIDAQVGRSLTGAGTSSENPGATNLTNGIQAIALDKTEISSAGAIIVALGTNGGDNASTIDTAVSALRADNNTAPIYWVDTIGVNAPNFNAQTNANTNTAIYGEAQSKSFQVISWFKAVDPGGNPQQPSTPEVDPNHYIDTTDGLGVHPTPAGVNALNSLVVGAVVGGGTQSQSVSSGACACGSSSSSSTTLVGSDNEQQAFNFFVQNGLTTVQAAAVIGNLMDESHMDPTIMQIGGDSQNPNAAGSEGWGIAQWTPGGKVIGIAQSLNINTPIYQLATQLNIVWDEMNGQSPTGVNDLVKKLETITDLATAVTFFQKSFEGGIDGQRQMDAAQALQQYGTSANNSGTTASSSSGCSGSSSCSSPTQASAGSNNVRQDVICLAEQELATWVTQPGYASANFPYAGTGLLKYTQTGKLYEEWCADFVSWIYNQAGYPLQGGGNWMIAGVSGIQAIGEQNGNFHWHPASSNYTPQPGDIAIHGPDHTNIFISSTGGVSTYIGGDQGNHGPYGAAPPTTVPPNPPSESIVSIETGHGYYDGGITGYVSPN